MPTGSQIEEIAENFEVIDVADESNIAMSMEIDQSHVSPPEAYFNDPETDTMLWSEPSTSTSTLSSSVPMQRTTSIATALLMGLQANDLNSQQSEAVEVATALKQALEPLLNTPSQGLSTIVSALVNSLTPIAQSSSSYDLRAPKPVRYRDSSSTVVSSSIAGSVFQPCQAEPAQIKSPRLTRTLLYDIFRDLDLSKDKSKLFGSRVKQLLKEFCPNIIKGIHKFLAIVFFLVLKKICQNH